MKLLTNRFFIPVSDFHSAAKLPKLTRNVHEGYGLFCKHISNIHVRLSTDWARLNFWSTGVACDMAISALHDRRQRNA